MASGYAKSTGKLPAVMIHTTVGALHATMAMRAAVHEQVPMVVFTGESIGFGEDEGPDVGGQWLGHLGDMGGPAKLVDHTVKWSFGVNTKAILPSTMQRACRFAMAGPRGPVFVSLPMEYLFDKMTKDVPSDLGSSPVATADPKGIEELANLLAGAQNPVIVAEDAGKTVKSVNLLVEIAELLGCPVVETRSTGVDQFSAHPSAPQRLRRQRNRSGRRCDLFGLGDCALASGVDHAGQGAKVAMLDENPLRHDMPYYGYQADLCLTGEIEVSLEHLLAAFKKKVSKGDPARDAPRRGTQSQEQRAAKKMARRSAGARQPESRWIPAGSLTRSARCCPRTRWWSRRPSRTVWRCTVISMA